MSLFLKYRPQTFRDLVGQENARRTLQNALKAERPAHAYLFTGSRGTGKTSTARIFAKGLNCPHLKDGDPCGECEFCIGTANGSLVDVIEIDAASNRGIDEIRDLREKINFAPNVAKRKVYIIDEVHMLTKEAFNALLKTLEEPPDHAFFCLATTELHKVPETIISRCQVFTFQRFTLEQLVDRLQYICDEESITTDRQSLELIARKAEGGLRDAISALEQVSAENEMTLEASTVRKSLGISNQETLLNFYTQLQTSNTAQSLEILKNVARQGQDFRSFGHDFLAFLREQMFTKLNTNEIDFILKTIEEIEKALGRLKQSPIVELPLEIAVINLTKQPEGTFLDVSHPISVSPPGHTPAAPKIEASKIAEKPPAVSSNPKPAPAKIEPPVQTSPVTENQNNIPADGFVFDDEKPVIKTTASITVNQKTPTNNPSPQPAITSTSERPDVSPSSVNGTTDIKSHMNTIVEKSGIPIFAKKSFLTTEPVVEGNKIMFYTDSEFHREKLVEAGTKSKLSDAILAVTGTHYEIDFIKRNGMRPTPPPSSNNSENQVATVDDFLSF